MDPKRQKGPYRDPVPIRGALNLDFSKNLVFCTAPTLNEDPKKIAWGPNGDLILSEMGTQWGPSTAEMGTQKADIWQIDQNEVFRWNKVVFLKKKYSQMFVIISKYSFKYRTHFHWQTGMGVIKTSLCYHK